MDEDFLFAPSKSFIRGHEMAWLFCAPTESQALFPHFYLFILEGMCPLPPST